MSADVAIPGATASERYVEVEPGVSLRTLDIRPVSPLSEDVVVFVAGWFSIIEGWMPLVARLAEGRRVVYVETREKGSSRIALGRPPTPADFAIDRLAADLGAVAATLEAPPQRTVYAGSSLGATVIHRALSTGALRPRAAVFIGATVLFHFPWIGRVVLRLMPAATWAIWRPVTLWYLRTFRVDARKEPEQMARYVKTLGMADPAKIKLSSRAFQGFRATPAPIPTPTLLAYAETDKLHGAALVKELAAPIPRATLTACPSNKFMHQAEMADLMEKWLDGLSAGPSS